MLTSSMLLINIAGYRILRRENLFVRIFVSISTYTFGCWYYIYGKLYYDFPFTAFFFSISFFLSTYLIEEDKGIIKSSQVIYVVFVLLGFTLSWKAYAVFPVIGLILFLFMLKKEYFYNKKLYIMFFLGFLFGWYSLGFNFMETVKMMRGYKASYGLQNMIKYLCSFSHGFAVSWDHVYCENFSVGAFSFPSLVFLSAASFFTRFRFFIVFLIIFVAFCSFIVFASPGYLWHGFPYSLFLMVCVVFFINYRYKKTEKVLFLLLIVAIVMQAYNNFIINIPMQADLERATTYAVNNFVSNRDKIKREIESNIKGDRKRKIFSNIKRWMYDGSHPTGYILSYLVKPENGDIIINAKMNLKTKYAKEFWDKYSAIDLEIENHPKTNVVFDNPFYSISVVVE
jgi:hypothetical protein